MIQINISFSQKKFEKYSDLIFTLAQRALFFLKKDNLIVDFFLVSEKEIQKINFLTRGKNQPTNILSFLEPENFIHPPLPDKNLKRLGEIYLCPPFIEKKKDDFKLLVIHGLLHLFGFDHQNEKEARLMEKKEKRFLDFLKKLE